MANNIAPELLKKVQERYAELLKKNTVIKSLDAKIEKGKATYRDADMYAAEVGDMLAEAYKVITGAELPEGRLLYDIADAVLRPTLTENYEIVSDMATKVQKALNEEAGLNLNAVKPSLDDNRVQGIIDKVADAENFDDIAWMLQAPVRNFAQNVVDEAVRANADFHAKVGLSPKIVRIAEPAHMASYFKRGKNGKQYGPYFQMEPCKWCLDLVGTYDYFDVKDTGNDVFRRHENCKCIVDYIPGNGKRQNVWDKGWQDINQGEIQERIDAAEKITQPLSEFTSDKLKDQLTTEDYTAFTKQVNSADNRVLYEKYLDRVKSIKKTSGRGVYKPDLQAVEWGEGKGDANKYNVLAHELNHSFDSNGNYAGITHTEMETLRKYLDIDMPLSYGDVASNSDQFLMALREDKKTLFNAYLDNKAEILSTNLTAGVQDALDGFYGNKNTGAKWGHGEAYYNRLWTNLGKKWLNKENKAVAAYKALGYEVKSKAAAKRIMRDYRAASELWANIGSAVTMGGKELEYIEKYLPNSYNAYMEIIRNAI